MHIIWKYLRDHRKVLIGSMALAAVNQFFSLLDPQILRLLIDRYALRASGLTREVFVGGVIILLLAYVGTALISRVAKNFQDYLVNVVVQRLGARMYARSVEHSFSLPYSMFEDQRSGELLQKMQKARTDAQELIKSFINIVFLSMLGILLIIVYALYVHWLVGLAYFLVVPILGITMVAVSRKIKKSQSRIVRETASLAGSTTETIRNVELVKSLGLERQEIDRLNAVNERILNLELKKIILVRKLSFWQGTMINGLRSIILLLMFWLVFQKAITIGEFLSLYIYSFFIFNPLAEAATIATQYQEAKASSEQLEEILNMKPESRPAHPQTVGALESLMFKEVSFTYASSNTPALRGITLDIRAGETVAFVGPSGSGKTTIVKLIAGLYRPSSGTIAFNEVNAADMDIEAFRRRIGLVSQETQLFAGTIRENLLFVNPNAGDAECLSAMQAAAAVSIFERGGKGLDTVIGEGGIKLSGGERQRLAIARAILRKPDLIIFDEATSSLDSLTEKAITETIQRVEASHPELMTILVAHRLSTVAHADTIYVLEKGRIIERGTHTELINRGGLYGALWREQIAGKDERNESEMSLRENATAV